MMPGMAPARGHDRVKQLVFESWGVVHIFEQTYDLAKIHVEKIARIHFARYTIGWFNMVFFILVGTKNFVPNVEQVTKIGIHVQWVFGVVHPMVRWGQDQVVQKPQPAIFDQVLAHMYERAPSTVNEHDQEEQFGLHPKNDANRGTYGIGIRGL